MSIGVAPLRVTWESMALGPNVFTVPLTRTATTSLVVVLRNRSTGVNFNNFLIVIGILISISQCAPYLLIAQFLLTRRNNGRQSVFKLICIGKITTQYI